MDRHKREGCAFWGAAGKDDAVHPIKSAPALTKHSSLGWKVALRGKVGKIPYFRFADGMYIKPF